MEDIGTVGPRDGTGNAIGLGWMAGWVPDMSSRRNVMFTGVVLLLALTFIADIEVVIDFVESGEVKEARDDIKQVNYPLVMLALLLTIIIFVGALVKVPGWVEEQNGRR